MKNRGQKIPTVDREGGRCPIIARTPIKSTDDDGQDGRGERVAGVPNHSESASEEFCRFTIDFRTTAPAPV